jgi:hypothetical protein
MTTLREAAQQALEALEWSWGGEPMGTLERDAITALRTALAAPPQRKPLTDEEILNIIDDVLEGGSLVDVARAIEQAHGIGGKDG